MVRPILVFVLVVLPFFFISSRESKTLDPYKVLGVDKNASQREIQKAFHKISLQYHPDKNKNKGAQEKFAEINNAYEILSDEDKRKNYDLHGDEKGNKNIGNHEGYTYFTSGGPGGGHFTSGPGGWQAMGSQGNARSFSSFGGEPSASGNQFVFDIGDMFSNIFGGGMSGMKGQKGWNHHGSFSSSGARSNSGSAASGNIQDINLQSFNKKIRDQGLTWLLLFYTPSGRGYHVLESVMEDVANSLLGGVKAGKINCQSEQALCRDLGLSRSRSARLFIYTYGSNGKGSLLEYNGEFDSRSLKIFCQDHLPRISKRIDIGRSEFPISNENLPEVLLLSTRKETPVMWRVISGLYWKHFTFYDAEVHDLSHPFLKKFGVEALPAMMGRLSNRDVHVLKAGVSVKDFQSGINELKALLENFERKNKAASSQAKKTDSHGKSIPLLTSSSVDTLCGDKTPVCVIGVFRSQKAREKLETILSALSRKTLVRIQNLGGCCGDSVSYSLLDANKQPQFFNSFDSSKFKSMDKFLLAYKPRKGKFAAFNSEFTIEEVEKFVSSVLNGDVIFSKVHQNPAFR